MIIYKADGSKWRLNPDGTETKYRWYHALSNKLRQRWYNREFFRKAKQFKKTGTRYYGGTGTVQKTNYIDIELAPDGSVCSVWFRCQMLPFRVTRVNAERASEMREAFSNEDKLGKLCGVEVKDPPKEVPK